MSTAPNGPLAWESPYAVGEAQEIAKRQKKKKKRIENDKTIPFIILDSKILNKIPANGILQCILKYIKT